MLGPEMAAPILWALPHAHQVPPFRGGGVSGFFLEGGVEVPTLFLWAWGFFRQKDGFPKLWFYGCSSERKPNEGVFGYSPRNESRNEGTFACSPGMKTRTRVHSPKPPCTPDFSEGERGSQHLCCPGLTGNAARNDGMDLRVASHCGLAHQNRTIAIASDFRVDGAKSPEIPQKGGVLGSEIAARNRKTLATFHRTLESQCSIAFSCLGNRCDFWGPRDEHRNRKSH